MSTSKDNPDPNPPVGGVAGQLGEFPQFPLLVAPTTDGRGKNTIRMELIPVACWKLNDVRFEFGSSFLLPESRGEFLELAQLRKEHPGSPLSVFGHADPVGDDVANKRLSGHRAESVYAVLVRDAARWEKLFKSAGPFEGWGVVCIQRMLNELGFEAGPVTGKQNESTTAAIRNFQDKNDLRVDGQSGPATRAKIFENYMKFLLPAAFKKGDFLSGGLDPDGKGDFQGCSEFNPVMIFSEKEQKEFQAKGRKDLRDQENVVNRRVMVLLFRKDTVVPPNRWPCPRANEGIAACKKRFWSDGEHRRSLQLATERRIFESTKDTFACRFYHRLTISSPCEGTAKLSKIIIRLFDVTHEIMADKHYFLLVEGLTLEGRTDSEGVLRHLIPATATEGTLKLNNWTAKLEFTPAIAADSDEGKRDRLHNLGYFPLGSDDDLTDALMRFQSANNEETSGLLSDATQSKLKTVYGC